MYSVIYKDDSGAEFRFAAAAGVVADFDLSGGVSIALGTSQGFGQTGVTVERKSIGGRTITAKGVVFRDVATIKQRLSHVLHPLAAGYLVFDKQWYIRVQVEQSPAASTSKNSGRFAIQFFAPYPYFKSATLENIMVGTVEPRFSFPVNYATPHQFGARSSVRVKNIYNSGDTAAPFELIISVDGAASNIIVEDSKTFKFLMLTGSFEPQSQIHVYRDNNGILRADLTYLGEVTDIIDRISDDSNLEFLQVGDNLINVTDDNGGAGFAATINFRAERVNVYES